MIFPTTVDKWVGPHLATVAKDEKIWFPTTVFAKNRYQDQIRFGDPKIIVMMSNDKWVGKL